MRLFAQSDYSMHLISKLLIGLLLAAWAVLFLSVPSATIAGDFYPVYHGAPRRHRTTA
jgi:hypothetical protein